MPIGDAKISVLDRGFIFGDGVYEVIPVYSRKAFRLAEHLRRLQHSLDASGWPTRTAEANGGIINELIARHSGEDQYLYLHITRGVAKRDHAFPNPPVPPTVFIMSNPLSVPPAVLLQSGVCASPRRTNAAALRHQGHRAAAQRIAAPDGGRCGLCRDHIDTPESATRARS